MVIDHIALWTHQLEKMKEFYVKFFNAQAGEKYYNPAFQFESYFLTFTSGARLELMTLPDIPDIRPKHGEQFIGYIHMAFSTGSEDTVTTLTRIIKSDGYQVLDEPRRTGDGYFESVVMDPDGNRVEITI